MKEHTYTLNVRQKAKWDYEVTIPEIGITVSGANFSGAIYYAQQAIVKHESVRRLILTFEDALTDSDLFQIGEALEHQAVFEMEQEGISHHLIRRERRLIFEITNPLTPAQIEKLRTYEGDLFTKFTLDDEHLEVQLPEVK